ncbi:MAG: hypothetical protein SH850_18815 [Planctomycetaceae bacterium]|nr:hypothetical protein [Planctomycetaceae bacterium]
MRSWFSTAVLVWVTAVLVTSPVLAARSCLDCCAEWSQLHVAAKNCDRCLSNAAAKPACCTTTTPSVADTCHGCPKCETSRPVPVMPVSPVELWQPSDLFVAAAWPIVPAAMPELAPIRMSGALSGRVPHPPLQILYCTWLT